MSDEFGTINVRRGERAREIEVLRQHYRQHREALSRMTADAPTEQLAAEYQRLIVEIDRSLGKLNELEGAAAISPPPPPPPPSSASNPRLKTEPGMRPLVTLPIAEEVEELTPGDLPMGEEEPRSRVPLILAATLVALVLIGWLVWRASSDRGAAPEVIAESTAGDTSVEETTTAPTTTIAPATGPLAAAPPSHDYGVIRKGTRATRQFEIANNSAEPVSIAVDRSTCRCLYYEHAPVIPPKSKESLTVTVDGAKAKAGELRESVRVKLKNDPTAATTVEIRAMIQ